MNTVQTHALKNRKDASQFAPDSPEILSIYFFTSQMYTYNWDKLDTTVFGYRQVKIYKLSFWSHFLKLSNHLENHLANQAFSTFLM